MPRAKQIARCGRPAGTGLNRKGHVRREASLLSLKKSVQKGVDYFLSNRPHLRWRDGYGFEASGVGS